MPEEKKKCFVIMPISDAEGYDKGHFTRVYEHLIKPAVIEAGFEPVRADDTSKANFIVVDILKQVLECEMAICDLSSRNPNVFYELGIRQAFNLKTVLIKDNKTIMPFDIAGIRTLSYSESLRIDEVKKAIPEIAKCIRETYDANDKEVNSLLQLLSIEKPATLPERVTLSQDSNIILEAISDLRKNLNLSGYAMPIDKLEVKLPNGTSIPYGMYVCNKDNKTLGKVLGETPYEIILLNNDNEVSFMSKIDYIDKGFDYVPF
ncbi:hypothetical protein [Parabacteroides goldsteinii]|uniref:hypothetical protein n=1 Tax=Parabacteroides goldsteinii TaxID=328812 RepID=UPI0032B178AD